MAKLIFKIVGALLLLGSLLAGWLWMDYQNFREEPLQVGEQGTTFVVQPGMNVHGIAELLHRRGIIDRPRYFVLLARLSGAAQHVQVGEYRITAGMTPAQLFDAMVKGRVIQYSITLVEGWNFREVMAVVNADPHLTHTLAGKGPKAIMTALGHPGRYPEGLFFPDTYHFPRGMSDIEFLQRAYDAMQKRLAAEWADRAPNLPLNSPYEALILASIVEKETGVPRERPEIAGVFVRRLLKGMRLQTDPTVIYGLGQGFDGNLRRKDLQATDNPYNTYRHRGLPPTPIAMPGGDAIHAALHPAPGDALYFVSKGDGSHVFSATLKEHNRAVIKYQLNGHPRPFSSNP